MGGVPKENEPRQSDASPGVHHQAPWTDSLGGTDSHSALHRGRVAQAQDCLVRRHPSTLATPFSKSQELY